jgi:uncharacterized protein (TIGR02466 family)
VEVTSLFPMALAATQMPDQELFDSILESYSSERYWRTLNTDHVSNSAQTFSLNVLDKFPELKDTLINSVHDYSKHVMNTNTKLSMTTSWLTRTSYDGFSAYHRHGNSVISGCYYFSDSVDFGDGQFVIQKPYYSGSVVLEYPKVEGGRNHFNSDEMRFSPRRGMLILFPSFLLHRVGRVRSTKPRYSLAFNTFPTGTFGEWDSSITIPEVGYTEP